MFFIIGFSLFLFAGMLWMFINMHDRIAELEKIVSEHENYLDALDDDLLANERTTKDVMKRLTGTATAW